MRIALHVALLLAATWLLCPSGSDAAQFDRQAWEADYRALKAELERSYAHLAWLASPEGGVDLPALDRATTQALQRAHGDAEAAAALKAFIAGFHDAHLSSTSMPAAAPSDAVGPPVAAPQPDARAACVAWGYGPDTHIQFSLPFESLPGFTLVSDGLSDAFRAGLIDVGSQRIGLVRVPRFRANEFPALCERVWASLRASHKEPTREAVADDVSAEWLRTLATRLRQLRERQAVVVLVDLGDNGGGNDLGDWAVRLFTSAPVHSAPMLLTAGPAGVPYFDAQLKDLRAVLGKNADLPEATRLAVQQGITAFEHLRQEATGTTCDLSWVWRERRVWRAQRCKRLVDGGFASGHLDYAAPEALDRRAAPSLYWASAADPMRGAWSGPIYVYTDKWTGSAAECFVALMRDRGIARTLGARTRGMGCGFADRDEPVVLQHAHLAFKVPNCMRLRADGTDDMAGVAPDFPLSAQPGESSRALALRALKTIAADAATPVNTPASSTAAPETTPRTPAR